MGNRKWLRPFCHLGWRRKRRSGSRIAQGNAASR
jgi:hypothetical protein